MTEEQIKKAAADGAKEAVEEAVKKAVEPIAEEVKTLKEDKAKLQDEVDALKKTSTGSKQTEDINKEGDKKSVKKGMFVTQVEPVK